MSCNEPAGIIPDELSRVMIYFGGPFYSYPFKPFWNNLEGATYDLAYAHFRRDHITSFNLFLHCLCLVGQLGGNFAFLNEIDGMIKPALDKHFGINIRENGVGTVSLLTALAWCYELVQTPAPVSVKILSVVSIVIAYRKRTVFTKNWENLIRFQGIIEALAVHVLIRKQALTDFKGLLSVVAARVILGEIVHKVSTVKSIHLICSFAVPRN